MVVVARTGEPRGDHHVDEPSTAPLASRPNLWALGLLAALCLPLVVAVIAFRRPTWTPVLDLAMTELRVRDVGGPHTPLIGLPGRIGTLQEQGSHPGPLSFYALAPIYRLLGSTAWALQVGTFFVHALAIATSLWLAARRGGVPLMVGLAAMLAALMAGYGGGMLTEPWNPYLPVIWWLVVLLAVWSVLCGDLSALPVAVLGASFCAQTHVPYLALALGMGALAAAGIVLFVRQHPAERRRAVRWVAGSGVLAVLLWLPPSLDQVRNDPGNYRQLIEHFASPEEDTQGLRVAFPAAMQRLDLVHVLQSDVLEPGWLVTTADGHRATAYRGTVLLAAWAASAVVAWRRRHGVLVRLNAVIGLAVLLMIMSISRVFGALWYYLTLWGWVIGCLALLSAVWTAAIVVGDRWSADDRARRGRVAISVVGALALVMVARFTVAATDSAHADAGVARELAAVIEDVDSGLLAGDGDATGLDGRYLVTWSDAFHIGSQGFGLVNELERRGFDVGVPGSKRTPATPHRVLEAEDATARVHLANGAHVDRVAELPGAAEVASFDPRSPEERAEQAGLRDGVISDLQAMGLDDLVSEVDQNLFGASLDDRLPAEVRGRMQRMLEIGAPVAVFVLPADSSLPL